MATTGPVPSVHNMLQISSSSAHHEINVLKSFALEAAGGVDRLETLVENAAKQAHDDTKFLETASVTAADHIKRLEKIATNRQAEDELEQVMVTQAADKTKAQELRITELEATSLDQTRTIQSLEEDVGMRDARILELKELEAVRYEDLKKQHARIVELEAMRDIGQARSKELKKQHKKIAELQNLLSHALKDRKKASSNKRFHTTIGQLRGKLRKANAKLVEVGMTPELERDPEFLPVEEAILTHEYKRKLAGLPPTPKFAKKG
ncbi:hypothetical protein E2P81_ATG00673 [Venturia nashicola]|nr:hypothetical protein E2P81_ATG00673 [Venturia nashicola]